MNISQSILKMCTFAKMITDYVNIHTHRPTGSGTELLSVGIHPWDAGTADLAAFSLPDGVLAIGEIGLDYAKSVDHTRQMEIFRAQLLLAAQRSLPVVIHCVKAFEPLMKELAKYPLRAVIFHGFIGSAAQAQRALDSGYYLSFGVRTFASPKSLEALRLTPFNRLFVETDDSDVTIEEIYAKIAVEKQITMCDLKLIIGQNYKQIFHI